MTKEFFIPYNTPSSKNSRINTVTEQGSFSFPSKVVQRWKRRTKSYFKSHKDEFLEFTKDIPKPLFLHMAFVRDSRRRFDFSNLDEIITDTMKEYGWIEDDNSTIIVPVFGKPVLDKEKPGVYIRLAKTPKYEFY